MGTIDVAALVNASSIGVVCWVDDDGTPHARGVVAMVHQDRPVLAFTYADETVARHVADAARVALVLHETRSTGTTFRPCVLAGTSRLVEDPDGDLYVGHLVTQELRRYPPSRLFADSPLLMREHWWYLPRLVVELDVEGFEPLPARTAERDHLLVVAERHTPVVRAAGVRQQSADRLEIDVAGRPVGPGAALLFGQDASFPDLERWTQWRYRGRWDGSRFAVAETPATTGLAPVPGLLRRWRRQRALQRRCVTAIERHRR